MERFVIVFENAPLEPQPWLKKTCLEAGLSLVDNEAITDWMSKDEEAQKVLVSAESGLGTNPKVLAPYYREALEKVAKGAQGIALYGSAWLQYVSPVDGCVLDLGGLDIEAKKGRPGLSKQAVAQRIEEIKKTVRERVAANLSSDRILELKGGDSGEKQAKAVAFIKSLKQA